MAYKICFVVKVSKYSDWTKETDKHGNVEIEVHGDYSYTTVEGVCFSEDETVQCLDTFLENYEVSEEGHRDPIEEVQVYYGLAGSLGNMKRIAAFGPDVESKDIRNALRAGLK